MEQYRHSYSFLGWTFHGDSDFEIPTGGEYAKVYEDVYRQVTSTDMMRKYHNLGTPANLQGLNDIQSLPWRNLQQTSDPGIATITGTSFADETLLRNGACSGCPVGCIHIGFIREKMQHIRTIRWQVRTKTGFDPENYSIPKRFYQVKTWKGLVDKEYLDNLKKEYGRRIQAIVAEGDEKS